MQENSGSNQSHSLRITTSAWHEGIPPLMVSVTEVQLYSGQRWPYLYVRWLELKGHLNL